MNSEQLLTELTASTRELIDSLSRFTPDTAYRKRSDNEWSAAEVAEHLLILETLANNVLRGEVIESTRSPDEKMPIIAGAMEDLNTKRTAPDAVLPSGRKIPLELLISELQKQRGLLWEITQTADLSKACIAFKHPALGTLTRMEWIHFTIFHSRRHIEQLKRIEKGVD